MDKETLTEFTDQAFDEAVKFVKGKFEKGETTNRGDIVNYFEDKYEVSGTATPEGFAEALEDNRRSALLANDYML